MYETWHWHILDRITGASCVVCWPPAVAAECPCWAIQSRPHHTRLRSPKACMKMHNHRAAHAGQKGLQGPVMVALQTWQHCCRSKLAACHTRYSPYAALLVQYLCQLVMLEVNGLAQGHVLPPSGPCHVAWRFCCPLAGLCAGACAPQGKAPMHTSNVYSTDTSVLCAC